MLALLALLLLVVSGCSRTGKPPSAAPLPCQSAWIWSAHFPDAAQMAPAGTVDLAKDFDLPADARVKGAEMLVGVDNTASVEINGKPAGNYSGWQPLAASDVAALLRPGANRIVAKANNSSEGPAGFYLTLLVRFEGGKSAVNIASDGTWLSSDDAGKSWQSAAIVAAEGAPPWGPCLPSAGDFEWPEFTAEGHDLSGLCQMLRQFHQAVSIESAGIYPMAWLPHSMLWVADGSRPGRTPTRLRMAARLGRSLIDGEGYVSCQQHEGLAHSTGWPFPIPSQSGGFGYYFTVGGLIYGKEFGIFPMANLDGWDVRDAVTEEFGNSLGWRLNLTAPNASITSPPMAVDAFVAPFVRVKWDATGFPEGSRPSLQWTTLEQPEFSSERQMDFPAPSVASRGAIQDFDIPIQRLTGARGTLTRVRVNFGNPTAGRVTMMRMFSAVDSRHAINNVNLIIASADYYDWTGDRAWLASQLPKLRRAAEFMVKEFDVREAKLLKTPWVGHDGRSGLEIKADGTKVIHPGCGIGQNYWDILPFGGEDAFSTIYLHQALIRMAQIESTFAGDIVTPPPTGGFAAADLRKLADEVRAKFQTAFWNPNTGRFAPKDDEGAFWDYGFTFLNNEAMFYGLASDAQAREILSWLNGDRSVSGDTSQGPDIYRWRFGPRSSTKRNLSHYAFVWSAPEALAFGDQVQDGGSVLGFSYHDLMSRLRYLGPDNAWKRLGEILDWHREVEAEGGPRAYYAKPGRGTLQGGGPPGGLGIDREFYESVLLPSVMLDGFIGFAPTTDGFRLQPQLPADSPSMRLSRVAYRNMFLDFDVRRERVQIKVTDGEVDTPLRVILPAGQWRIVLTRDGRDETFTAADSFTLAAGPLQTLMLEPLSMQKTVAP